MVLLGCFAIPTFCSNGRQTPICARWLSMIRKRASAWTLLSDSGVAPPMMVILGQDILDIYLLSTLADAICCPDKFSKKHGSLKSCNSYIRAFMIPMLYDFSSDDRHYTCNSCFSVISSCSDNMFHRPHSTAKMCRGCRIFPTFDEEHLFLDKTKGMT